MIIKTGCAYLSGIAKQGSQTYVCLQVLSEDTVNLLLIALST